MKPTRDFRITDAEQYAFVTSQTTYFANRIQDMFKWFFQMGTAIAGGYIWLQTQVNVESARNLSQLMAPWLILGLGVFSVAHIWFDFVSWYGYRKAQCQLLESRVRNPSFPKSALQEIFITLAILLCSIGAFTVIKYSSA